MNTKQILVTAFRALTKQQRANLLWHCENGSHICCGSESLDWIVPGGG